MLKKIKRHIPHYVLLLLKIYGLTLLLFLIERCFFYYFNQSSATGSASFIEKCLAFKMGLEFDTAAFCWIAIFPGVIFSIGYFFNKLSITKFGYYLFLGLLLVYHFVCIANIPYFKQFGNHLSKNALLWNENPGFVVGMILGSFSYWGYLLLFLVFAVISIKITSVFFKTFKTNVALETKPSFIKSITVFILLSAFIVMGARGRLLEDSPLHEGLSIVSQNTFVNLVGINPNFTFWKSLLLNATKQPYVAPTNINESIDFTKTYLGIPPSTNLSIDREIKDSTQKPHHYNVVIVVMESMSVFKMGYYGGPHLTPNLDKLNKESIFCENFFSSGIHTFNGLFSTSSGYPSIYSEMSLKSYLKTPFNGIGTLLKNKGYSTYYYTTQEPHFDNMEAYFKFNGFDHIISQYDCNEAKIESSLGVPDHVLFDKLIETTNKQSENKPFLAMLMTASDHGPWKMPSDISYKPNGKTQQENCTLYADWSIGRFMEQAKKQPWYNNTVFLFLGDHGLYMGHTYEMPISYNHVPLIIHQPNLFKADTVSFPAYQPDVTATVMGIIGEPYTNSSFGIDILKQQHPYVVFSSDDKIGCVDNQGYYYYTTLANKQQYLRKYKNLDPINYITTNKSKADSMHRNMMHIYNSAEYLIHENYFLFE